MARHRKTSVEIPHLVEKARKRLPRDDHDKAPRVADEIMAMYRDKFRDLPTDFYRWCREGLYQLLCARFKQHGTDEEVTRQGILDLWAHDPVARNHVARFGDSGFYLGDRYVDLTPERTVEELRQGAEHKRKFGLETLAQAAALEALAKHLERRRRH
jgi:hypothetical protein